MSDPTHRHPSPTAAREEEIVAFWNDAAIFEKTLQKDAPAGEFVFYDGPPFATGLPHMGHLLISAYKDAIGRYKTMRGYRVPRRWGWDCHGLPIENIVEKKLGLTSKKDIEEMGIAAFNEEARKSVLTYVADWKRYIERLGRWVDFDNSYKTLDNTYIESVWWALKKIHEDGRLYEGRKVLMYCPHCETPLSKAEIAMDNSYKDVTDTAVFVQFQLVDPRLGVDGPVYMLAWTTTPWTLPGNVALAVGANSTYALIEHDGKHLIVAKERLAVVGEEVTIKRELFGAELVGMAYEPLYAVPKAAAAKSANTWHVVAADFVTTDDGTGVVHIAPMYGEDDYNLGQKNELPVVPLLDATGTFNADAPELVRGMYFKKGGKYVMEDLTARGVLFASHDHTHSYPHCYRCGTALYYNALTSWFIDIQSVKDRLLEANEQISWYPSHLKEGRFKHNLETAPDWTISRNRFWASPLPIWKHATTDEVFVVGSLAELRAHTKRSGNTYLMTRHGESESNSAHVISSLPENTHGLTERGREQVRTLAEALREKGVTKIVTSPLVRTRETAEIVREQLGLSADALVVEDRFKEWQLGELNGRPVEELRTTCPTYEDRFERGCGTGETLHEMKQRIGAALYDLEARFQNETILIVGHEYTLWLAACVAHGADQEHCITIRGTDDDYVRNATLMELDFVPLPHNARYELDLHRPYIDDVPVIAPDGSPLVRIPEVVDCWVESGAMSFAPEHYPMENTDVVQRRYPADFIAEYIAQTRTWFYYMHALGVLLFDAPSFKHCVTTGTVLAADGSKMSKSKQNYTDPIENIDRYGADALRYYLLGSTLMAGEDVAFKDEELREAHNRFINMLWNSFQFYLMNRTERTDGAASQQSQHVLDRWISARLDMVVEEVTVALDAYDTIGAARTLREFVSDLSTWYIRRSRDRFKADDADRLAVADTSRQVFLTLAKVAAPIVPFIAESMYRELNGEAESVHLLDWPVVADDRDRALIDDMAEVRRVASLILEARQRAGIKVRQPLARVTVKDERLFGKADLCAILLDEVNILAVEFDTTLTDEVSLDTELTDELRRAGAVRDLVRAVQALRKQQSLSPEEAVDLIVCGDGPSLLVDAASAELARIAQVRHVLHRASCEGAVDVSCGDEQLRISLARL